MLDNIIGQLKSEYCNKYGVWETTNSSDLTIRDRLEEMDSEYGKNFIWTGIDVDDKAVISIAYADNDGTDITSFILG